MSIGLSDDQVALSSVVENFLAKRQALRVARDSLQSEEECLPNYWDEMADLGWFGLHLPERYGGSGGSFEDVAVLVEQLGRCVTSGPIVPTLIAGAAIATAGDEAAVALLSEIANG